MRTLLGAVVLVIVVFFSCVSAVDWANAKETTSLDDALNRPVVMQKYVDEENNVVCYWPPRHPQFINCVYIPTPGLTWRNKRPFK